MDEKFQTTLVLAIDKSSVKEAKKEIDEIRDKAKKR